MNALSTSRPTVLLASRPQTLWGWPAVINFSLGGLGAGAYVVAALADGLERSPAMSLVAWLAPALVLAGFAAVATEAGRPLRGPRVLLRVRTSWMSRELWLGGAFVLLAIADLVFPLRAHRAQAATAALLLVLAQGFILRRARGVSAWDVPIVPSLFVLSALVSGAGCYVAIEGASGRAPGLPLLAAVLGLLGADLALWVRYLTWSHEPAFVEAVDPLARGRDSRIVVGAGHVGPFVLVAVAAGLPLLAAPALVLAGGLMVLGQVHAKARLILGAGRLRPLTLAGIAVHRRST